MRGWGVPPRNTEEHLPPPGPAAAGFSCAAFAGGAGGDARIGALNSIGAFDGETRLGDARIEPKPEAGPRGDG
jgi:hypothetical protein